MIITSTPTSVPSQVPVTSIPTTAPSITGLVVSVDITSIVSADVSESEISSLQNAVATAYGVDEDDISSVTEYVVSGTMDIAITDSASSEEVIVSLTDAMADTLDVAPENIKITIDASTGEVVYVVSTSTYDNAVAIQSALETDAVIDDISSESDSADITSLTPALEIVADTTFIVDADDISVALVTAENTLDALLDDSYNTESEGMCHFEFYIKYMFCFMLSESYYSCSY